ncbi:LamG domain-containing protein, partial [Candidatus Kaiserbacteria bacterium]|nr:LamG domain-containing protein [Candidatus Kaiserbacteria bacterium]
ISYEVGQNINTSQNSVLTNGLVGLWSFNGPDMAGVTAYDRSGQGNHGTLTNGPVRAIGKIGQGLRFDGTDDYVNAGTSNFAGDGAVSESMWVKFFQSESGSSYHIMTDLNRTTDLVFYFDDTSGTELIKFGHRNSGGNHGVQWDVSSAYASQWKNKWKHFVVVYDGGATDSATSYSFYVDGVLYTTGKASSLIGGSTSSNIIGYDSVPVGGYLNGLVDEVRIYNRALTAAEVKLLYNSGK